MALVVGTVILVTAITLLVLPKAQALVTTVSTAALAAADVVNVMLRTSAEGATPDEQGSGAGSGHMPDRLAR